MRCMKIMEKISNSIIRHNTIYIPKKFLNLLKLKNNDMVLLRCNTSGLLISKQGLFTDLDALFGSLDSMLKTKKQK